jgi:tellurite resistance protein TehA-like permease
LIHRDERATSTERCAEVGLPRVGRQVHSLLHSRSSRAIDTSGFAFVMATGIVSVAAGLQHLHALSEALLVVACVGWTTLAFALLLSVTAGSPGRPGPGSFALVAATAVLGTRFSFGGQPLVALALWALALSAWLALLAVARRQGRADGGWFLVVVGTESLAVLASLLAPRWGTPFLDAALGWWLLGLCLYPAIATAIAAELRRCPGFAPALWITMGALAIATLAGTELLLAARTLHALTPVRPVLRVGDLMLWALASAWILPLAVAELRSPAGWRNPHGRWSFVFPLGMYAVASQLLARAAPLPPLAGVGRAFFGLALLAWTLMLIGHAAAGFRPRPARYNNRTTM